MTKGRDRKHRPAKGTVRDQEVREAKRKMFWLVDDPLAIVLTVEALRKVAYPPDGPKKTKSASKDEALFFFDKRL